MTKKTKKTEPRTIIDAKPHHWNKWVVVKGFNDNTVVAYGDDPDEATKNALKVGYKIAKHRDDPSPQGILLYCPWPCGRFFGAPIYGWSKRTQKTDECPKECTGCDEH